MSPVMFKAGRKLKNVAWKKNSRTVPENWHRKIGTGKLAQENWHRKIGIGKLAPENWHRKIGTGKLAQENGREAPCKLGINKFIVKI